MTLSIKNTAGALYKSQIKGENRYCLWLRNSHYGGTMEAPRTALSLSGSTVEGTTRIWHATIPSPTHT